VSPDTIGCWLCLIGSGVMLTLGALSEAGIIWRRK
jgi:hypothetical protein